MAARSWEHPFAEFLQFKTKQAKTKELQEGQRLFQADIRISVFFSMPTLLISLPLVAQARNGSILLVKNLMDLLSICQNLAFLKYRHYLK